MHFLLGEKYNIRGLTISKQWQTRISNSRISNTNVDSDSDSDEESSGTLIQTSWGNTGSVTSSSIVADAISSNLVTLSRGRYPSLFSQQPLERVESLSSTHTIPQL